MGVFDPQPGFQILTPEWVRQAELALQADQLRHQEQQAAMIFTSLGLMVGVVAVLLFLVGRLGPSIWAHLRRQHRMR